jgi:hypothetical protein
MPFVGYQKNGSGKRMPTRKGNAAPDYSKTLKLRGEEQRGSEKAVKPPLSHFQKLGLCASRSI